MALTIRRKPDGSLASNNWYADFEAGGRRYVVALGVAIEGMVPANLRKNGDRTFEKSRGAAQAAHDKIVAEARSKAGEQKLVERLIEIKTSDKVKSVTLDALPDAWAAIPRKRTPSAPYIDNGRRIMARFVEYIRGHHPRVRDLADVSSAHVRGFMDAEQSRGVSPRLWNATFMFIRSAFRHLEPSADACRKYLASTPSKEESTVHREPFKPDEIQAVLEAAKDDELMRPLIVTALCTAMRRGDCALLKWESIDLTAGFVTVKTSKTGETVEIPIMPLLRGELLKAQDAAAKDAVYVFPAAAELYQRNADGLNYRLREILFRAGFVDAETAEKVKNGEGATLPIIPANEVLARGLEAIKALPMIDAKRERIVAIFKAYTAGQTIPEIVAAMQVSKGTVSGHLNEIEKQIGAAVIRHRGQEIPVTIRGTIHAAANPNGGQRLNRGSLRGWHSFRTTFITIALSAGLPMELVRRVTGHTTVDVVLKHYFRPGREQFRAAMQKAMPLMLSNGAKSPKEEIQEILDNTTVKQWKQDVVRIRNLVAAL